MAMQAAAQSSDGLPVPEINTTPLIDVLLVLLVMIMTALPPQFHGVNLDTPFPCPDCAEEIRPEPISIVVDFDGSYTWNGALVDRASLDGLLAAEARTSKVTEIHIQPHQLAEYQYVVHVMAAAQRAGLTRIGVLRTM